MPHTSSSQHLTSHTPHNTPTPAPHSTSQVTLLTTHPHQHLTAPHKSHSSQHTHTSSSQHLTSHTPHNTPTPAPHSTSQVTLLTAHPHTPTPACLPNAVHVLNVTPRSINSYKPVFHVKLIVLQGPLLLAHRPNSAYSRLLSQPEGH